MRRRIGAYLDGALEGRAVRAAERHLAGCRVCRREADALRSVRHLVRRSLGPLGAPPGRDWAEFWPAVLRAIETEPPAPATPRPMWIRPRWALGGALVAVVLGSMTLWSWQPSGEAPDENPVVVSSADTEQPGGSVMVYRTPEKDMTVVWVFEVED